MGLRLQLGLLLALLGAAAASERCFLPKVVGRCRAAFPRWWYDPATQTCQKFTYGGCGANTNNFLSEGACQQACGPAETGGEEETNEIPLPSWTEAQRPPTNAMEKPGRRIQQPNASFSYQEYCTGKFVTGPCRAAFPRWWFDSEKQTCRKFIYGGCRGSKNNFLNKDDCMRQCSEFCAAPSVTGLCRASLTRWYFDSQTRTCQQFIYGGCEGNKNNYVTEEQCWRRCSGHEEDPGEPESEEHPTHHTAADVHTTRAVALAVLLAIMAAILLGSTVVFFVRLCKRNEELSLGTVWSTMDDKECLVSNAYTL